MINLQPTKYNLFLESIIDDLEKFKFKAGAEGRAYFVDDYVIKKITKEKYSKFDELFELYCEEMNKYALKGYNVPYFFAWTKKPSKLDKRGNIYDYYILQERIKGRQLYLFDLYDVFDMCTDLCSEDEFYDAIENFESKKCGTSLYKEILKRFIDDFVQTNELICGMPQDELDKFLLSIHDMFKTGRYSMPDIFVGNVLRDDKKLSIIDNRLRDRWVICDEMYNQFFVSGILDLFLNNREILGYYSEEYFGRGNESLFNEKRQYAKKTAYHAIDRVVDRLNIVCDKPKMIDALKYKEIRSELKDIFSADETAKILAKVNYEKAKLGGEKMPDLNLEEQQPGG